MSGTEHSWDAVIRAWREALGTKDDAAIAGPATCEAIAAVEGRLGIALPAELRDLYSMADGLPALHGDMYGVRSCAELVWFRDAEPELIAIWEEINSDGGFLTEYLELMRAGLAVSKGGDEYRLFFVPTSPTNSASRDDWQLYRQSNDGDGVTPQGSLIEHLLL
jgi:cell wall assembly regulator SMI1